ncbi:hypothetical protein, partial [Glycomyces tenuis]|uniref:hypothetical protein n=1 Tax=Glycomyces tenuis TaxID=58116 RepID=UPI00042285D8
MVENREFNAFARRIIRAYGKRVASGDVDALPELIELAASLDEAITEAVKGLRSEPFNYSWTEIADRIGMSRQAAQQRWGRSIPQQRNPKSDT